MVNVQEFYDYLEDNRFTIEECVNNLERDIDTYNNIVTIEKMFQEIATTAKQHELSTVMGFSLTVKSIFSQLSNNAYSFIEILSDVVLLSVDHLFDLTKNYIEPAAHFDPDHTITIKNSLEKIANSNPTNLQENAANALRVLTSQLITSEDQNDISALASEYASNHSIQENAQEIIDEIVENEKDIQFFKTLIGALEYRFPTLEKRSKRILSIAIAMNESANSPVNSFQLEAAIYVHDVGMSFIPDAILFKNEKLEMHERKIIENHPDLMSELLVRMGNWQEASTIVLQHHEKMDGSGYPKGLSSEQISDGAKILSILDAFDAMTQVRADRPYKKTILRAISEIVKNPTQFDAAWTKIFINVIKSNFTQV